MSVWREFLRGALARRELPETQRRLAKDYTAGRRDAAELLRDLEAAQLELLADDDAFGE